MAIATETIFKPHGFSGYLARPERATALPGVVVIQEAWGVDAHIEDVTRRFAAAGYLALAPDLFADPKAGTRPAPLEPERMTELVAFVNAAPATNVFADAAAREAALGKLPEADRARVAESLDALRAALMDPARREGLVTIAQAAVSYLREERAETRAHKIASVGFCVGGALSATLACRDAELGAAVIFYGTAPAAEEIPKIRCPVLGLYGGADQRILAGLPAFTEAMKAAGKRFEQVVYDGVGHAFFNDGRPTYDVGAARDGFARVLAFLKDTLV
ncbi:MAG TPA: dienelactone hydrolase family protein [Polyangia bacterium]|nr:dienelactone hydrolase family protein [Polyangia bacterium]